MEEKLICGQYYKDITESEEPYIIKDRAHEDKWFQCMDCYCEEYEYIYGDLDDEESYADHYDRTNYGLYGEEDPNQWDEEE